MTPELSLRTFTDDQFILDKVFYSNFYRLKGWSENPPIVLDLGAHCGYFSFTALAFGAKKVYAFEPFLDNYRLLLKNAEQGNAINQLIPHQVGVYVQSANVKFYYPKLGKDKTYNFSNIEIDLNTDAKYHVAPCLSLDEILMEYVHEKRVDILKLNIGYAENAILEASNTISRSVKNICGEVTATEAGLVDFKDKMAKKGFNDSYFSRVEREEDRYVFIMSQDKADKYFDISTEQK